MKNSCSVERRKYLGKTDEFTFALESPDHDVRTLPFY